MRLPTWACILLLPSCIICDLAQDHSHSENAGRSLQFTSDGRECCPCPKPGSADESALPDDSTRDSLPDSSAPRAVADKDPGSTSDCLCKPRDSDSAASISDDRYSETQRPVMRNTDMVHEDKTLLHPEVDLASSVLKTLRDATEEEYRDALARKAVRNAADARNVINDNSKGNDISMDSKPQSITIIINATDPINDTDVDPLEPHTQETRCASSSLRTVNEDTVSLPSEMAKSYVKLDNSNTTNEISLPKFKAKEGGIKLKPLKELLQDIHLKIANNQLGSSEQAINLNNKVLPSNIVEYSKNSEPGQASTNSIILPNLFKTSEGDIKLKPLKKLLQEFRANKKNETGKIEDTGSNDSNTAASNVKENLKIVSSKMNLPTLFTKTEEGIQFKPIKEFLQDFHPKSNNENQNDNISECRENKVSDPNVENSTFENKLATPKINLPSLLTTNENGVQLKPLKELLQELQPNNNKQTTTVNLEKSNGQDVSHDNRVAASNFKENIENGTFMKKPNLMQIKLPSMLKTHEGGIKLKPLKELLQDLHSISTNKVDHQKDIDFQNSRTTASNILKNIDCNTSEKEKNVPTKSFSDSNPTIESTLIQNPVDKPFMAKTEGMPPKIIFEKEFNNESSQNLDADIDTTDITSVVKPIDSLNDSDKFTKSEITRQGKAPKTIIIDEPQEAASNNDYVLNNNNFFDTEKTAEMNYESDLTNNDSSQPEDVIAVFDTSITDRQVNQESFEFSSSDDSFSNPEMEPNEDTENTEVESENEHLNTENSKENQDLENDYEDQMVNIASVEEKNDESEATDLNTEPSDLDSKEFEFVDKERHISDTAGSEIDQNDNFDFKSNVENKNFVTSEDPTNIMNKIDNDKEVKYNLSSAGLQEKSDSLLIRGLKDEEVSPTECVKDANMSENKIMVERNDSLQLSDKSLMPLEGLPDVRKVPDSKDNPENSHMKSDVSNVNNISEDQKKRDSPVTKLIENLDKIDHNPNVNVSNDFAKNDVITCLEALNNKGPNLEVQNNTRMAADASDTIRSIMEPPNPLFRNLGKQNSISSLRNNLRVQSESLLDDIKKSLKLKPLISSNNLASSKVALPSIEELRFKINDALGLPSLQKPIATQARPTSDIFSKRANLLPDTFNFETKPKIELPRLDIPKAELPKLELPRLELPKQEMPILILPKFEFPKIELPRLELPRLELPKTEFPKLDLPPLLGSTKTVNMFEESLEKPISNLNLDIFQFKSPLLKQSNSPKPDSRERLRNLNAYRLNIPLKQPILVKPLAVKSAIRNKEGFMGATLALKPEPVSENMFEKSNKSSMKTTKTKTQKVNRDQINVNKMKTKESLLTTTKPLYAGIKNKLQVNPKTVKVPKLQPKLPETGRLRSSFVGNQDFISKKLESLRNSQVGKDIPQNLLMLPSANDKNYLQLGAISNKNYQNSNSPKATDDLLKSTIRIKINNDNNSKNLKSSAGRPLKTNNFAYGNLKMLASASNQQVDRVQSTTEEQQELAKFKIPRKTPQTSSRNSLTNEENLQEARLNDRAMETDNNKFYGKNLIQTLKAILGKLDSINNNVYNMNTREQKLYSNLRLNKPYVLSPRDSDNNDIQLLGKKGKPTLRTHRIMEQVDFGQRDGIAESTSLKETNSNLSNEEVKSLMTQRDTAKETRELVLNELSSPKALTLTTNSPLLESTLLEKLKEALDATRSRIIENSSSKPIISNRAIQKARNNDMENAVSSNIESSVVTDEALKENVNYRCKITCSKD